VIDAKSGGVPRPTISRRRTLAAGAFRGLKRGLSLGAALCGGIAALVVLSSVGLWLFGSAPGRSAGPFDLAAYLLLYRGSGAGVLLVLVTYSCLLGAILGTIRAGWALRRSEPGPPQ
jgi:hypothetical protein